MYEKHRNRRIIYNDDGDQMWVAHNKSYGYNITDEKSFIIDARTTPTFDTHADTYVFCVGNGCEPPWGKMEQLLPFFKSAKDAHETIVQACHTHNMEVWASLRMNDIHDSFMADCLEKTNDPLKAEHPEYLIAPKTNRDLPQDVADRHLWTAFNFARPEVRQYRLEYIEKNASECDWDGYELDFTRFIWNFALGTEQEHIEDMTDFIRKARKILNDIENKRGRPMTFVVHVHDSLRMSYQLGLDVETWVKEELVDVLIVGMGYCPYLVKMDEWMALGRQYHVPVYPSVNTNTYGNEWQKKHDGKPVYHEGLRASSSYYWQVGADGLYLFNLFCQKDKSPDGNLSRNYIYAPLKEIGEPDLLKEKGKLYTISPVLNDSFYLHGTEETPLPIALDKVERKLSLYIGQDAEAPNAKFRIRAFASGGNGDEKVRFRLNHKLITCEAKRNGSWYEVDVPAGVVMRTGRNELAVWCNKELAGSDSPIIIHHIFVPVSY
jgi:hypothetical protein